MAHNAPLSVTDHHCFSNTVIGLSFRVCLGAEELEQWYGDRRDFLANLPTHATRVSRSPCFRLCSEIRKKSRLFCRLLPDKGLFLLDWRQFERPKNGSLCFDQSKVPQISLGDRIVKLCSTKRDLQLNSIRGQFKGQAHGISYIASIYSDNLATSSTS